MEAAHKFHSVHFKYTCSRAEDAVSEVPATRQQPPAAPGKKPAGPEQWPDPEISQAAGMGSSTEGVLARTLICGVVLSDSGSRNRQLNYTLHDFNI